MVIATFELDEFKVEILADMKGGLFKVIKHDKETDDLVFLEVFSELYDAFEKFSEIVFKELTDE